jgi:hypothetical protein
MKRLLVLPVWLALALTFCAAAPVKVIGPDKAAPYTLVELQAEGDLTGAAVLWDVSPDDLADVRELPNGKMIFTGPPGVYKVRCTVVRLKDGQTIADRQRFTVTIGTPTPPVPPGPNPPGPPGPTPGVAPIDGKGLHVLIVYESADLAKYPVRQLDAMQSSKVRGYLNEKCPPGPVGGQREWWMLDKDVDMSQLPKKWQDAMKRAKADPKFKTPWLIVSNPDMGGGYEGPVPDDADKMLEILKRYGG